ncbi:hypothetical protein [Streptomyces chrestomyceticus]|uniref:hypothetical protein n=1 Tax=Streptomyces chrestomyceticus TaxID=68185 RepID=UPI0033D0F19E
MPALLFFLTATVTGLVGLVRTAPRHAPGRYAVPVAGTTAVILTLAALGAALYR